MQQKLTPARLVLQHKRFLPEDERVYSHFKALNVILQLLSQLRTALPATKAA